MHQMENEMQNLRDLLSSKKTESEREHRRKERLERELNELRTALDGRMKTLKDKQAESNDLADAAAKSEQELREERLRVDKAMKEMKGLEDQFNVLKAKHRQEVDEKQRLHQDNLAMQNQIKTSTRGG